MKNAYVKALTESILAGKNTEQTLLSIKKQMEQRGHLRLWPQVLKASMRVLQARLKSFVPQVVIAKEGEVSEATLQAALEKLGATEAGYTKTIDQNLVGGFTARVKGTFYDASYKRALVDLYRRIIT